MNKQIDVCHWAIKDWWHKLDKTDQDYLKKLWTDGEYDEVIGFLLEAFKTTK